MFAVRKVGTDYKLCIRRGRLIEGTVDITDKNKTPIAIKFRSQARGKECIDILNADYYENYDAIFDREGKIKDGKDLNSDEVTTLRTGMLGVIKSFLA